VDCQGNWTYWIDNYDSQSVLSSGGPVINFADHNLQMYVLGDCTEMLVKDFNIPGNTFAYFTAEDGKGPNATLIGDYCDATIQGFVFDAAAPCRIDVVNAPMAVFNSQNYSDLTNTTVGVLSTANFQGTARFFSTVLFAGPRLDFNINGGDMGFDLVHMSDHAFLGSRVNGGVLRLINNSAYITYNGTSNFPPYSVAFGTNAGIAGKVSEFIGCYAYNGCTFTNLNTNNHVNVWLDYALRTYTLLSKTNQLQEFQPPAPALTTQWNPAAPALVLQWPANVGAYSLYATPGLTSPAMWTFVPRTPILSNNQWTVTLPIDPNTNALYRLQQ